MKKTLCILLPTKSLKAVCISLRQHISQEQGPPCWTAAAPEFELPYAPSSVHRESTACLGLSFQGHIAPGFKIHVCPTF